MSGWDEYKCMRWQALKSVCEQNVKDGGPGAHAEVLKWLHANGCPWDGETLREAERMEHYDVAEWARANVCPEPISQSAFGAMEWISNPGALIDIGANLI